MSTQNIFLTNNLVWISFTEVCFNYSGYMKKIPYFLYFLYFLGGGDGVVKLTEKQKRFADYYIETGNATESARRAGYKKPHVQGSQTLEKLSVKSYIEERLKQMDSERIASAEEVLKYLTSVMRGETQSEIVVVENVGDFMSEARTMNKAPDEKERLKAAELIGKRYALWTDKQQIEGVVPVTIVNDLDD